SLTRPSPAMFPEHRARLGPWNDADRHTGRRLLGRHGEPGSATQSRGCPEVEARAIRIKLWTGGHRPRPRGDGWNDAGPGPYRRRWPANRHSVRQAVLVSARGREDAAKGHREIVGGS